MKGAQAVKGLGSGWVMGRGLLHLLLGREQLIQF